MITLQKEQENPLKISFCFSKRGYNLRVEMWLLRLYHQASCYTEVLQCGTISMPTGR